jgi:glutathione S-transferase
MAKHPILYSFRRCPYAIRARLALLASGIVCEIREVKLSAKPAEMVAISPKATVPVLELPDGRVIDQSLDIMRWALARNDPADWLERSDDVLIDRNDGPFKYHLDRYKYPDRHDGDPAEHRTAGLDLLRPLEERLGDSRYLCGDAMGLADAALMPFVRQFAETDRDWFDGLPLPHLQSWLRGLLDSSLFMAAMVRLAPWKEGDAPILFPAEDR